MIENKGKAGEFERVRRTSDDKISGNNNYSLNKKEKKTKITHIDSYEEDECIILFKI